MAVSYTHLKKLEIEIKDLFITPKMLSGVIDKVKNKEISLDHGKKILRTFILKNYLVVY